MKSITMCSSKHCPREKDCYRKTALEDRQTGCTCTFNEDPARICDYFVPAKLKGVGG